MLESNAYNTYYAFTSGEKTPKLKYVQKKADPDTSPKQKPVQATKGTKLKSKAKVAKTDKKKQPSKKTKAKGLAVLSEVMELTLSQSKDEDEDDENDSDDLSDEGDDDNDGNDGIDGDDDDANDDDKQESDDTNDDDEETDSDRTKSNIIKIPVLDQSTTEFYEEEEEEEYDDEFNIEEDEMMDEEENDEVTKELYKDVNVNLGNKDVDMTDADHGGADQQNVSQQSGFEQEEEDAHVTLTPVLDTQKTGGPTQSSSVSSNFTSKLLNLNNLSPADNKIASLRDTTTQYATAITKITSSFTTTVPPPPFFFNPLRQEATPTPTPTTSETTTTLPTLPDFASIFKFNERVFNLEKDMSEIKQVDQYAQALSSILAIILPQAISDVATPIIKKNVTGSVEALVLTRSSSQLASTYEADASLSEFELTKILIDKMEKNKSYDKADYKKKLYDALVESYNTDKDLFDSYGEVFLLKRSQDERDKDRDSSAGSDRVMKRRKSSKDAESSRDSMSKENKSSSTSKDASQSQHKSSGKSAHAEEPSHTVEDSGMQQDQENSCWTGINLFKGTCESITELECHLEECSKATTERLNWHNPENKPYPFDLKKPLSLIQDHQGRQIIPQDYFINKDLEYLKGRDLSRRYSTSVTKTKAATYDLKWIEDLVPNLYARNLTLSKDVYSIRRIIAVTRLKIMKKYDYGHLEEIEVNRVDQKLYTFKEGDFKRLRLQDIEDMLLLIVQQKLTNLTIDERYDLNVALRMYTRHIIIQRRVEDL
ncbi:hypothetical protein Tco_0732165 [Tanacetum coccineum]